MIAGRSLHDTGAFPRYRESRKNGSGRIAQLVEQLTLNQRVLGSSPSASTKLSNRLAPPLEGHRLGKTGIKMVVLTDRGWRVFASADLSAVHRRGHQPSSPFRSDGDKPLIGRPHYVIPVHGPDGVGGRMSKSERLKALLAAGCFPEELPPAFTTADFAK